MHSSSAAKANNRIADAAAAVPFSSYGQQQQQQQQQLPHTHTGSMRAAPEHSSSASFAVYQSSGGTATTATTATTTSSLLLASTSEFSPQQQQHQERRPLEHNPEMVHAAALDMSDATASECNATGTSYYENWASPTEVLLMRTAFHDLTTRYRQELAALQAQLMDTRGVASALADEQEAVQQLKEAYTEGNKMLAARTTQTQQWEEERELMRLHIQRLAVENQRLQLYVEKTGVAGTSGARAGSVRLPSASMVKFDAAAAPVPQHVPSGAATGALLLPLSPSKHTVTYAVSGGKPQAHQHQQQLQTQKVRSPSTATTATSASMSTTGTDLKMYLDDTGKPMARYDYTLPHGQSSDGGQDSRNKIKADHQHQKLGSTLDPHAPEHEGDKESGDEDVDHKASSSLRTPSPFLSVPGTDAGDEGPSPAHTDEGGAPESCSTNPSYAQGVDSVATSSSSLSHRRSPQATTAGTNQQQRQQQHQPSGLMRNAQPTPSPSYLGTSGDTVSLGGTKSSPSPGATTTTTTTASALSSSIACLYHLPRTPAEALQEEVRLLEALTAATQHGEELEAKLEYTGTLWSLSTLQRDQRLQSIVNENERLKRELRHWRDATSAAEARAAAATEQLEDSTSAYEEAQRELQEVKAVLARLQAEGDARTEEQIAVLRQEHAHALACARAEAQSAIAVADTVRASLKSEFDSHLRNEDLRKEEMLAQVQELEAALAAARRVNAKADAEHEETLSLEVQRRQHAEEALVTAEETLARVMRERTQSDARVEALSEELQGLYEARAVESECFAAMETRLAEACTQLLAAKEQQANFVALQHRSEASEQDSESLRAHYEAELRAFKGAMESLQEAHRKELGHATRRYEKLLVRFQGCKVQLAAALKPGVWTSSSPPPIAINAERSAADDTSVSKGGGKVAVRGVVAREDTVPLCDPVEVLKQSTAVVAKLCCSINRSNA